VLLAAACGGEVPILMYHSVGAGPDGLTVTADQLDQHLTWLAQAGFTPVTLKQVFDQREGKGDLPARPIVLSFDDGFQDAFQVALPILQRHEMRATFFIVSGFLSPDASARQADPSTGRAYLVAAEVRALRDAGMEIGSHTVRHASLTKATGRELRYEIEESKRALEATLGERVEFFAYPFTHQRHAVRKAVQTAGYRAAVSGARGGLDRYDLQRVVIHRWTTARDLAEFLAQPWGAQ
jgi:peptidoglycan/xylan/chitin deacetylase (PgdA/CDA1 family)